MNQTLYKPFLILGLAAGAAGIAPLAVADIQRPTVYGKLNVSLERVEFDGAGSIIQGKAPSETDQWEVNSNASRLGVKGEFDLEDTGLTAIYQAEYEINVDDGANGDTAFSQRNTFAGIRGYIGEIRVGKFDTPLKAAEGKIDQFNDLDGDLDNLIGGQNRVSNIVQYTSPLLAGGITLNAAFIPAEGTDVDQDGSADDGVGDSISLSAVYDNKTIYAALAYDKDQLARRSVDGIKRGDLIRLVGGWKSSNIELGILLQQTTDNANGSNKEDASYLVSGAFKSGKFKYKAQYGLSEGDASDEQGTLTAVGVDYRLTSKADIYTYWSLLDLDNADLDDQTLGFGVSFSF